MAVRVKGVVCSRKPASSHSSTVKVVNGWRKVSLFGQPTCGYYGFLRNWVCWANWWAGVANIFALSLVRFCVPGGWFAGAIVFTKF